MRKSFGSETLRSPVFLYILCVSIIYSVLSGGYGIVVTILGWEKQKTAESPAAFPRNFDITGVMMMKGGRSGKSSFLKGPLERARC